MNHTTANYILGQLDRAHSGLTGYADAFAFARDAVNRGDAPTALAWVVHMLRLECAGGLSTWFAAIDALWRAADALSSAVVGHNAVVATDINDANKSGGPA